MLAVLMKSGDGTQAKEAAANFSMEMLSFFQGRTVHQKLFGRP